MNVNGLSVFTVSIAGTVRYVSTTEVPLTLEQIRVVAETHRASQLPAAFVVLLDGEPVNPIPSPIRDVQLTTTVINSFLKRQATSVAA
jgi:hypothetical protein